MSNLNCPVCGNKTHHAFNATVLRKHNAVYYSCVSCGYLFTNPTWLDEAYSADQAIVSADTGLLKRNTRLSDQLSVLLHFGLQLKSSTRCLDMAGGYGLLTRTMRDIGFNFFWQDKYCQNVMARGFESKPGSKYQVVTAFEVLEHVTDPVSFVRGLFTDTGAEVLVFSTELFKGRVPSQDWWHYVFETGQHISFYQERTLQAIADTLGLQFWTSDGLHMMARPGRVTLPKWLYKVLVSRGQVRTRLANKVKKLRLSLTTFDHKYMLTKEAK